MTGSCGAVLATARQRGDVRESAQVGGSYQPKGLKIYVIRSDPQLAQQRLRSIDYPYAAAANNFLAVRPNTILIGETILADVLLTITNDVGLALQAADLPGPDRAHQVTLASALAAFTRLGNLRNTIDRFNPDHLATTIVPKLLGVQRLTGSSILESVYYHGLLFILAHEISHLQKGSGGALLGIDNMLNWIADYKRGRILEEEKRADAASRTVVVRALLKDDNMDNVLAVYAVVGYMRDEIGLNLFEGFRGMAADNRLVSFRYGPCDPKIAAMRGRREDNIDAVSEGFWNPLPILGRDVRAI